MRARPPPRHGSIALPAWAKRVLDAAIPGWRALPGAVTFQSVRRAGQWAHRALHAPRAVVRGTATARLDGARLLGWPEDREVALAQACHAEVVAREWTAPSRLPARGPRCIPARVPSGREPWAPGTRASHVASGRCSRKGRGSRRLC
jgi:hypothetical protein